VRYGASFLFYYANRLGRIAFDDVEEQDAADPTAWTKPYSNP
jgi:hypothetical protein